MSVSNGQVANQTTFNNAFVSRTVDSSTVGKVDLLNEDAESGATVENIQRELNSEASYTGKSLESAFDDLPAWGNNDVGTSGDNLTERADALTAAFNATTGHNHEGGTGEGPPLATAGLENDAVTNTKLANMANGTIKGRHTAATGDPEDLSGAQATSLLVAVVGDSGSGGTKGLVPAPAAGDAAADKFLSADGTWAVVPGGGAYVVTGTNASPISVDGSPITAPTDQRALVFIAGDADDQTFISSAIADGTIVGQEILFRVPAGSNSVIFGDGANTILNGPCNLGDDAVALSVFWDGSSWVEMFRS